MIHFVGAGSGAPDLITIRGKQLIETADILIYAGSLVNPELLLYAGPDCKIYNSAEMTLEEVFKVMEEGEQAGKDTVRLHTGDPCLYGAVREQMDLLDEKGLPYDYCPGVSSFCGAAAARGSGKRKHCIFCCSPGHYGDFPQHRNVKGIIREACGRRIRRGDTGGHRL